MVDKQNKIIDFRLYYNRGRGWVAWLFALVNIPISMGLLRLLFGIEFSNEIIITVTLVSIPFLAFIGRMDYKRGLALKEAERLTFKYNPYFDKIGSKLDVIADRLKRYNEMNNDLIRQLNEYEYDEENKTARKRKKK